MWNSKCDELVKGKMIHFTITENYSPLLYRNVINYWIENDAFRDYFLGLLANSPFNAFR